VQLFVANGLLDQCSMIQATQGPSSLTEGIELRDVARHLLSLGPVVPGAGLPEHKVVGPKRILP